MPVVCVVGGGTAGLEGLLAARETLGPSAEVRLIAPESEFRYRPMRQDSLFHPAPERSLAVADLVAQTNSQWVADRAEAVRSQERKVLTRDGDTVDFDFLLISVGARYRRTLKQGQAWVRGGDPSFLDQILGELRGELIDSVAVVVPRGARWPIPAYELALILAWTSSAATVTLLTAEPAPLGALGADATTAVSRELEQAGVEVITRVEVLDAPSREPNPNAPSAPPSRPAPVLSRVVLMPEGSSVGSDALRAKPTDRRQMRIGDGEVREFDRLVSLPTVRGPFLAGVPTDATGFVEVDAALKVCGCDHVWAAGSCIAAGLGHSALSARQADAAVASIAAASTSSAPGADTAAPEVAGLLLADQSANWRAENPPGTRQPSTRCLWWPPGRAVGRMLAQRISAWDPTTHETLPSHPTGVTIRAPVALGCSGSTSTSAQRDASPEVQAARLRDIENRQIMAVGRRERAADDELRALRTGLQSFEAHEREVVRELQRHGYLRDREQHPPARH